MYKGEVPSSISTVLFSYSPVFWGLIIESFQLLVRFIPRLFWFEFDMLPTGSCIWTFWRKVMALFGKDVEPSVGVALLEGIYHGEQALKWYNLTPLAVLCFMCAAAVPSTSSLFLLSSLPWLPHHDGVYSSGTIMRNKLFLLRVPFCQTILPQQHQES